MNKHKYNDIVFSYERMELRTFENKYTEIYYNVNILEIGNSRHLKINQYFDTISIESKMIFGNNNECITS